ncbi:glucose repression mediator protein [Apophysomyces ossiformis]|uniref:Glucose repression mediator protein n=1 Tax=Apophysomyces ossiformis TaxID=679940 RepID=A0A8H7BRB5_9FUNG|nr:glucose repression mediator protein [Apophysomyces ossiformis]
MAATVPQQQANVAQKLAAINEQTWLTMGNLAEMMTDYDKAMTCYESALRHNPYSIVALSQIASLCRGREQFARAVEYFKRILAIQENNGETWAALGHCYLMMDNLQEAYQAYQQALYHLSNPKDPKLWYGIGILYDRYGSLEHAEEAFSAVMKMDPKFEKANEIYFRLGIIYKQQQKFDLSLQCFRYILHSPPRPLTESDIWFQTGHVYEQQKEYELAKEAYERVLKENPDHAKVLQQLGWLYHQQNTSFANQTLAIQYLTRSLKSDSNDAQSWYLLGRCYMAEQNYNKAYEAYQQAVYRDARNPTFWCSIGVLYYQINQYRDALDAYSRAIRLNPYISEVWYDLGTLYESCNNQIQDALDAYQRAAELDPSNPHIKQRLELLRKSQQVHTPQGAGSAPIPQDVSNPSQYQNGPSAQPLNGAPYGHSSGPGAATSVAAYHTASRPSHPNDDRAPPPHLSLQHSAAPHDNASGPGRDLPMPSGPSDRRSPGPYPQYQPPAPRDDVRIPDIGNGGGRAPTPSERTQMNPIMQGSARAHGAQTPPAGASVHQQGSQANLPPMSMRQSPYPKSNEAMRSPSLSVSGDSGARSHIVPPYSGSRPPSRSGQPQHLQEQSHYDSASHHMSPRAGNAETYHPHYEQRRTSASHEPLAVRQAENQAPYTRPGYHEPPRQSPSMVNEEQRPTMAAVPVSEQMGRSTMHRGSPYESERKAPVDEPSHRPQSHELGRPPLEAGEHRPYSKNAEVEAQHDNQTKSEESLSAKSSMAPRQLETPIEEHKSSGPAPVRHVDEDYDESAADALLSISHQPRGNKRSLSSDEGREEELKKPRPSEPAATVESPLKKEEVKEAGTPLAESAEEGELPAAEQQEKSSEQQQQASPSTLNPQTDDEHATVGKGGASEDKESKSKEEEDGANHTAGSA